MRLSRLLFLSIFLPALLASGFTWLFGGFVGALAALALALLSAQAMGRFLQHRYASSTGRIDSLTRLYNHGYMLDRAREEVRRSERSGRPFSFLMLDVDHFKRVNDRLGHQTGDAVLVNLAKLLQRSCRATDIICRYGGEEIGILLVDTNLEGALRCAENLRSLVSEHRFGPAGNVELTLSLGVAEFSVGLGSTELLRRADEALYRAKAGGRDRACAYHPEDARAAV